MQCLLNSSTYSCQNSIGDVYVESQIENIATKANLIRLENEHQHDGHNSTFSAIL